MDVFQTRLSQALSARLGERIAKLTAQLISSASPDHAHYMERVGVIRGLKHAMEAIQEVEIELGRPEKGQQAAVNPMPRQTYEN
jgi:hypothetical protein